MAGLDFTDEAYDGGSGERAYYQHMVLEDLINDFMMAEVGEGMLIPKVKQSLVEYHAQRAVQELSYDTLRTVKSFEWDLDGSLSLPLPQDFVGLVGVFWVDDSGYKHFMNDRGQYSGAPTAYLQDDQGNPLYDMQGERLTGTSDTVERYNMRTQSVAADAFYNYYAGSFENDELYDRYYSYYGRRFGSDPTQTNINGTYVHDVDQNLIHIDAAYSNQLITVDYVSDGLGTDVAQIRVHKYAEEAIYAYIRFKLIYSMRDMPLNEKQLVKKEYAIAKRRAKHRLSDLGQKLRLAFQGKTKWIKH